MATSMITLKMDQKFLQDIDAVVRKSGYQNRTEFIRNALREKVEETKMKQAMMRLAHLKGSSQRKTSDAELKKIREKVFHEIDKVN